MRIHVVNNPLRANEYDTIGRDEHILVACKTTLV